MKKIALIAAAMFCTFMYADAQYLPEKGAVSTELYYSPGGADSDGHFALPDYGVKVRIFFSENIALTANLGMTSASSTSLTTSTVDNNVERTDRTKNSTFAFSIMPGIEYHFANFERVSPYFGAAIGVEFGSSKERTDNNVNSDYALTRDPVFGLGAKVTGGVDVYICKGFYAGLELGLGYNYSSYGKGKSTSKIGDTITETEDNTIKRNAIFGFFATPSIRIGWLF